MALAGVPAAADGAPRYAALSEQTASDHELSEHRVVFTPSGLSGTVEDGTTVLNAAVQLGADLDTVCGGRGICGRCQIEPSEGEFAKWAITVTPDALSDWGTLEENYEGKRKICLLYTSPSPRDATLSRMPSSA